MHTNLLCDCCRNTSYSGTSAVCVACVRLAMCCNNPHLYQTQMQYKHTRTHENCRHLSAPEQMDRVGPAVEDCSCY